MKVKDLIKRLEGYDPESIVAYELWSRVDVISRCEDMDYPTPTDEQCDEILTRFSDVGCDIGQSWDTMDVIIEQVLDC